MPWLPEWFVPRGRLTRVRAGHTCHPFDHHLLTISLLSELICPRFPWVAITPQKHFVRLNDCAVLQVLKLLITFIDHLIQRGAGVRGKFHSSFTKITPLIDFEMMSKTDENWNKVSRVEKCYECFYGTLVQRSRRKQKAKRPSVCRINFGISRLLIPYLKLDSRGRSKRDVLSKARAF